MGKIIIAGASSGIGYSLAQKLTEQKHSVISVSRNSPSISVSKHITYDVQSGEELPVMEGVVDGLVYCPGSITLKPFKNLKQADFQKDLDINFFGAVKFIQHYLPNLLLSKNASIVLFSTVASQLGMPYHTSIAAAKGAIEGFAKSLAAELAPIVRVNIIAPSLVKTPLAERLTDTEAKITAGAARHPMKRIGEADDIAEMAMFLLNGASWITGQVLHVDGGMSTLKI